VGDTEIRSEWDEYKNSVADRSKLGVERSPKGGPMSSYFMSLVVAAAILSSSSDAPQDAAAGLAGTAWQLVKFQSSGDKTLVPDDKAKYTIAFGADGKVSLRIDCSRGGGTWKSSGSNQIEFGPLALTRAMRPTGPLNERIPKDWQDVQSYAIKNGHLFLSLKSGGTYEFEPSDAPTSSSPKSPVESRGPFEFVCTQDGGGNVIVKATFYQTTPGLVLVVRGGETRLAFQVLSADGGKYEGRDIMFWDVHGGAQMNWDGVESKCSRR
jgi:heat shock protein HslJ